MSSRKRKFEQIMSSSEEEEYVSSSSEALNSTPRSKKKKLNIKQDNKTNEERQQEIQEKIEMSVSQFIKLRNKNTNIHPMQDAAISYIIRIFQHFLYRKTYTMKTNLFIQELQEKYGVKPGPALKLRTIINSIPATKFTYTIKVPTNASKAEKKAKKNSRQLSLIKTDINFNFALKQIQQIAILFKYTAYDWGNKPETNIKWKWVGNGIEDITDKIINYEQISNSNGLIVNINDIVIVRVDNGVNMRPWIGRVLQLFHDDEDGEMKVTLRWFWFWNQILDEITAFSYDEIEKNARNVFSDWPPRECDIFESMKDNMEWQSDEPVNRMCRVVDVVHTNSKHKERLLDGINVFECNYTFNPENIMFYKKGVEEMGGDEERVMKRYGEGNVNGNRNVKDDGSDMDLLGEDNGEDKENNMNVNNSGKSDGSNQLDDDLDLSDIKGNALDGFKLESKDNNCEDKDEVNGEKEKEKDKESDLSESEIQSDNSLTANTL